MADQARAAVTTPALPINEHDLNYSKLLYACRHGDLKSAYDAINAGAPPNGRIDETWNEYFEIWDDFAEQYGLDIFESNYAAEVNFSTRLRGDNLPLCLAVRYGHVNIVELLLQEQFILVGVDPATSGCGETTNLPIRLAAYHDHTEIVRLLLAPRMLELGVNPASGMLVRVVPSILDEELFGDEPEYKIQTNIPLFFAASFANLEIAEILMQDQFLPMGVSGYPTNVMRYEDGTTSQLPQDLQPLSVADSQELLEFIYARTHTQDDSVRSVMITRTYEQRLDYLKGRDDVRVLERLLRANPEQEIPAELNYPLEIERIRADLEEEQAIKNDRHAVCVIFSQRNKVLNVDICQHIAGYLMGTEVAQTTRNALDFENSLQNPQRMNANMVLRKRLPSLWQGYKARVTKENEINAIAAEVADSNRMFLW